MKSLDRTLLIVSVASTLVTLICAAIVIVLTFGSGPRLRNCNASPNAPVVNVVP
ncbi:MAG: hypothetical protein AAF517_25565 [Planctomycetota bacterium]